jgi:prepilin-type N-terminal cleavage/methylation domain-containing protein
VFFPEGSATEIEFDGRRTEAAMKTLTLRGITLIELLVVIVIISLLATIAAGSYINQVRRSKIALTKAEIRTMEVAINRYQIDTGHFPLSFTGTVTPPPPGVVLVPENSADPHGSGFLQVSLQASYTLDPLAPLAPTWQGPYLDWPVNRLGRRDGTLADDPLNAGINAGLLSFMDPFQSPYYYVRSAEYLDPPVDFGVRQPTGYPYAGQFFNPSSFQIISFGPNRAAGTPGATPDPLGFGDDITNFTVVP